MAWNGSSTSTWTGSFDRVQFDVLMARVARKVADRKILRPGVTVRRGRWKSGGAERGGFSVGDLCLRERVVGLLAGPAVLV